MTPSPNPHLEEIDNALINLKPGARTALMTGLASAGMQPQAQPEIPGAIPVPEPKQQQMDPGMVGVTQEQAQVPGAIPIPPSHVGLPPGVSDRMAIPQIGPVTPPKSAAMTEYERITAPGLQGDLAHTKSDTGRSGIGQIHNPWARIPLQIADAVGSTFFPGISMALPGTELHHRMLVNDASNAVGTEQDVLDNQTKRGLQEAQTAEATAQAAGAPAHADEAAARAESLRHPKDENEAKTVTTAAGIFGWNPATKRFDIKVGEAPEDKGSITHILDRDGNAFKLNHDGTATPIKTPDGKQVQGMAPGPEAEKPLGNVDQMNAAMTARYQVLHPGGTLPPHFTLPPHATRGDYERIDKAMEATERALGTKAQQDQSNEMRRQTMAIAAGNRDKKEESGLRNATLKEFTPAVDSAERFNVMAKNYEDAIRNHDQQAMLSLLANHLGMTMGLQKGARMTKDIIQEAERSRPWLQGMKANFSPDGVLSGVALTPEQMRQMVNLGRERFAEDITKARNNSKYLGSTDDGPARTPGRSTINHYLGLASGDLARAKQLAAADGWSIQ